MKKFLVLVAVAMLFVPATASAFEVVVPYFLDGGKVLGSSELNDPAVQGGAAFITMVNLTSDTLTLGVVYTDGNGVDATPADNTFELAPFASDGFRPVADDPGTENQSIPNALQSVGGTATGFARDANGNGGRGGVRFVLAAPGGIGDVTDYPDYANWPPAPFTILLNQYIFYDWALAGSGMEQGFISKPLEK